MRCEKRALGSRETCSEWRGSPGELKPALYLAAPPTHQLMPSTPPPLEPSQTGFLARASFLSRASAWLGSPKPRLTPYRVVATVPPLAALVVSAMVSAGADVPWLLDLCTPWVWPALVCSLLMSAAGAPRENGLSLLTALLCASVLWSPSAPDANASPAQATGPGVTLASVNVLSTNREFSAFKAWLATSNPDVVAVLEVSPEWATVLEGLEAYPHQKRVPRSDNFGIALISKFPLEDVKVLHPPVAGLSVPSISAVVQSPKDGAFKVISTHPIPPISARAHRALSTQIGFLASAAAAYPGPAVLMGDFNATPWSSAIRLAQQQGLHRVSGTQPTWPAKNNFFEMIPIDHILGNSRVVSVRAQVGPNVGSDHLPVMAIVRMRPLD